eukprot:scaffold72113_cov82-Phaeocystis_antarctica.AAC.4
MVGHHPVPTIERPRGSQIDGHRVIQLVWDWRRRVVKLVGACDHLPDVVSLVLTALAEAAHHPLAHVKFRVEKDTHLSVAFRALLEVREQLRLY